jgi:hypothetical protein
MLLMKGFRAPTMGQMLRDEVSDLIGRLINPVLSSRIAPMVGHGLGSRIHGAKELPPSALSITNS